MVSALGGFAPDLLTGDSAPGPRWGLCPRPSLQDRALRLPWALRFYEQVYDYASGRFDARFNEFGGHMSGWHLESCVVQLCRRYAILLKIVMKM